VGLARISGHYCDATVSVRWCRCRTLDGSAPKPTRSGSLISFAIRD